MRIKDILVERELRPGVSATMPATNYYPELPSSSPYHTYRFGMSMADHTIKHPNGPSKDSAVTVAYSEGEQEILDRAEKKYGVRPNRLADAESAEPEGTNKNSPVAKPKRNKYGV